MGVVSESRPLESSVVPVYAVRVHIRSSPVADRTGSNGPRRCARLLSGRLLQLALRQPVAAIPPGGGYPEEAEC